MAILLGTVKMFIIIKYICINMCINIFMNIHICMLKLYIYVYINTSIDINNLAYVCCYRDYSTR